MEMDTFFVFGEKFEMQNIYFLVSPHHVQQVCLDMTLFSLIAFLLHLLSRSGKFYTVASAASRKMLHF